MRTNEVSVCVLLFFLVEFFVSFFKPKCRIFLRFYKIKLLPYLPSRFLKREILQYFNFIPIYLAVRYLREADKLLERDY